MARITVDSESKSHMQRGKERYIWIKKGQLAKRSEVMATKYATDAYTSDEESRLKGPYALKTREPRGLIEYGITKEQFYGILDKAAQPTKESKPDSETSQT